jgi:hypothetical protein
VSGPLAVRLPTASTVIDVEPAEEIRSARS